MEGEAVREGQPHSLKHRTKFVEKTWKTWQNGKSPGAASMVEKRALTSEKGQSGVFVGSSK
jgi:hypothetical protein